MKPGWEAVIGLEIHVQLNTKSKLFSAAPNLFGEEPNRNITAVCTGQPGALPVLNKEAVKKAVQFGCAIEAEIAKSSLFDRKSYFYPDSPRNYQITQYDQPIVKRGVVVAEVDGIEKSFTVHRAHLEDDTGMLKHFPDFTGIDYNRAGCSLLEIVSEPCIHTPQEAVAYAMAVKAILEYINASDCNMDEGSFRIDANISVRPIGEQGLRNKIEIKNMNSFSFMEMALKAEIHRQIDEYSTKPHLEPKDLIHQSTYRWDAEKKETVLMRRKESADDYRYFPEPDLMPIVLTEAYIQQIREGLPELPLQRERRYVRELGLAPHQAFTLVTDKVVADYFEEALETCRNARALSNWILVEFGRNLAIKPSHVAGLVNMIDEERITGKIAKSVAEEMILNPCLSPEAIVKGNPDYQPLSDKAEIEKLVDEVLAVNEQTMKDIKAGHEKAFEFLVGEVMKLCRGRASPQLVNQVLHSKIAKM